jgi:hypothetical protein
MRVRKLFVPVIPQINACILYKHKFERTFTGCQLLNYRPALTKKFL